MSWQSIHLFLADPERTDAFLLEVIGPAMAQACQRGEAARWFFIRYWEGGPHLRLRVAHMAPAPLAQLQAHLHACLARYLLPDQPWPAAYPDDVRFERAQVDAAARRWLAQGSVRQIAYQAELQRYGGVHALPVSEHLFCVSSDLALQTIAASATSNARRTRGLLLTSVALAATGGQRTDMLAFLAHMKHTWQTILGPVGDLDAGAQSVALAQRRRYLALIAHLHAGGAAPPGAASTWWTALQAAVAHWRALAACGQLLCPASGDRVSNQAGLARAIAALIDSHIHMMNNRLGLTPAVEYWYAHLLEHTLLNEAA